MTFHHGSIAFQNRSIFTCSEHSTFDSLSTYQVTNQRKEQKFDWVMLMEVLEHIPSELHGIFFQNINAFAKHGILMSWAPPQYPPIGHTNPLEESEVFKVIFHHLPDFVIDHDSSAILRAKSKVSCLISIVYILKEKAQILYLRSSLPLLIT